MATDPEPSHSALVAHTDWSGPGSPSLTMDEMPPTTAYTRVRLSA